MPRITIIEDDLSIATMYRFKFEAEGYQVQVAHDGVEGLKTIQAYPPDLILLDIRMPVMAGDTMLEHLRSKEWGKNIRVVILTNISRDEAPQKLRLLNVDRYVVKAHHTPQQILTIVREILK